MADVEEIIVLDDDLENSKLDVEGYLAKIGISEEEILGTYHDREISGTRVRIERRRR